MDTRDAMSSDVSQASWAWRALQDLEPRMLRLHAMARVLGIVTAVGDTHRQQAKQLLGVQHAHQAWSNNPFAPNATQASKGKVAIQRGSGHTCTGIRSTPCRCHVHCPLTWLG